MDRALPGTFDSALKAMRDRAFLASARYQEQQGRALRRGAHPDIVEFERVFVWRMAKLGVPMFCHCMIRTPEQQRREFLEGNSKNDGKRPYPHRGFAVDIIHSKDAWNLSETEWKLCHHVGAELAIQKGIDVTWGGKFRSLYDPAHWELTGWRELYPEILAAPYEALTKWELYRSRAAFEAKAAKREAARDLPLKGM